MLEAQVFQSRFGFHSCDYVTFVKLKRLKKLYWQAVRRWAAWRRWDRKEYRFFMKPRQYGVRRERSDIPIPEPVCCPVWQGSRWTSNSILSDYGISAAFEAARHPVAKAEDVKPLGLHITEIDLMLAEAEEWAEEK